MNSTEKRAGPSIYHDAEHVRAEIAAGAHRAVIGGLWEEMGRLQRDFLIAQGLQPEHRVIDVGCGSLRAGVPLTRYLAPRRYFGIDLRSELLDAGYQEIRAAGLEDMLPRDHLAESGDFDISMFGVDFDFGLAQSVFTHIPLVELTRCLNRMRPHFKPAARFYATFFERPEAGGEGPLEQKAGIVTFPDRDPFDVRRDALAAAVPSGWRFGGLSDWGHPRGQKMAIFTAED